MLRITAASTRLVSRSTASARLLPLFTTPTRSYASSSSNEGKKGPLTGRPPKPDPNAGKEGPLTSKKPKSSSSDGSKQSKNAEASQSTTGAEASDAPTTAPGQGMEDKGGHAMPSGPGEGGAFAEQGDSALSVAGAVDGEGTEKEEGRGDKVDPKFWSDKKK